MSMESDLIVLKSIKHFNKYYNGLWNVAVLILPQKLGSTHD